MMFERTLKYFKQSLMTERREFQMQNIIGLLVMFMIFEDFEKIFLWRAETLTITNFQHFSLGGVDTLTILV